MAVRPFVALCALTFVATFAGCGGGGASGATSLDPTAEGNGVTTATIPVSTDTTTEPNLGEPVSRFAVHQSDLGQGYLTDVQQTFNLTAEDYAATAPFKSAEEGVRMLTEWGYREGYETGYEPEGRTQAVLNGAHYIQVEVHLFESAEGAKAAFEFFEELLRATSANISAPTIGNQSSAWRLVAGTVPGSSVEGTYHRIVARRGNLVSVILTWGADPFMTVDAVLNWARVVDAKALGEREATEPTATNNVAPRQ